ncbi:MAG: ATP-dependent Clp protease proteolytic subunit, partial [Candidatus Omnitrophica bacterium]|nr:ATP-dependent Clp protease proteolytic subunit [Candidatus Omnitrophota bacterium]
MSNRLKENPVRVLLIIFLLLPVVNAAAEEVLILPVKGVIELGLSTFIKNSLQEAEKKGINRVILEMDTPGGRVDAADIIAGALLNYPGETITFVINQAWSAGSMIALATDKIIMQPASSIGSAEPRQGTAMQETDEKIVSALRARFKALAEQKGHNTALAQAMVDKDVKVFKVLSDGKELILTEEDLNELIISKGEGDLKILATISDKDKLLNLTANDAYKHGLTEAICKDREVLLAYLNIENARTTEKRPSWSENMVRFITHPVFSSLLLGIGFWAIITALRIPGLGLPEIVGVTALGLFFWGHRLAGLSKWLDILLVIAGIILILVELFLLPGFGITGLAGITSLLAGIVLTLIRHPIYPPLEALNKSVNIIFLSFLFGFAFLAISLKILPKSKTWKNIILQSVISGDKADDVMQNREGTALSAL